MRKLLILMILAFLILLAFNVSALTGEIDKNYKTNYDLWIYREDISGKNRGFSLKHYWSSPKYNVNLSDNVVNWRVYDYLSNIDQPPRNSYSAANKAFDVFASHRTGYRYSYTGYSGYGYYGGYVRNSWW